jgi:hypothetical protein
MKTTTLIFVIITISLTFESALCQGGPVAKSIDTTHQSVVAILRVDSSGRAWINATGVLIHPQVILTAGHVNFDMMKLGPGGSATKGIVTFGTNAYNSQDRRSFNWLKDVETHPDSGSLSKSFSDTTGQLKPSMFIDVGLLFLQPPVEHMPLARLPDSSALARRTSDHLLIGVGFGYHKTWDSTFTPNLVDGQRRQWRLQDLTLRNDLWLRTQCDTVTNLPFISMYDSGAPLLLGENVVVGVWSFMGAATNTCAYSSWAVRIDNPRVLTWIKNRVKLRLGVDLN